MIGRDLGEVSQIAARIFAERIEHAISTRGQFTVALSGGTTPKGLYHTLATAPYRSAIPWPSVHLFWGDERCRPPTHPESNYQMVKEALLVRIKVPAENIHRIPAELEYPQIAADSYEQLLRTHPLLGGKSFPKFDLVLLGLGEDGHTASLFPGSDVLNEKERWVSAPYVHKLSEHRITLTPSSINHATTVLFVVSGESKAHILKEVLESDYRPDQLPAQLIRAQLGQVHWVVDRAAASKLTRYVSRS
ncbi:MAG: 6-phosphogluconolactonase [Acidobacteria bacterium]|nr:6-phosphogluconolactonase [Acidobacteriota bacterium]